MTCQLQYETVLALPAVLPLLLLLVRQLSLLLKHFVLHYL